MLARDDHPDSTRLQKFDHFFVTELPALDDHVSTVSILSLEGIESSALFFAHAFGWAERAIRTLEVDGDHD